MARTKINADQLVANDFSNVTGSGNVVFVNGVFDTIYGDGSNLTNVTAGDVAADDIKVGNAAVNLYTTSGQMTLSPGTGSNLVVGPAAGVVTTIIKNGQLHASGNVAILAHNGSNAGLSLGGTLVTSTAAELNLVDGSGAGTIVNSKGVIYGSSGEVNATTLQIAGTSITATAAEINYLDNNDLTAADITKLAALTSTAAELNYLDNDSLTAADITKLAALDATAAELNYLDNDNLSAARLAYLASVTAGTAAASKAVVLDASRDIATVRNVTSDGNLYAASGGFGALGATTVDASGAGTFGGNVTAVGSFIIGSAAMSESDLEQLDGITAGTAAASKAVVLDGSKDVAGINNLYAASGGFGALGATTVNASGVGTFGGNVTAVGSFIIGSADMNEADLEKLDGITNGTAAASKAVVLDGSKDVAGINNLYAASGGFGALGATTVNASGVGTFGGNVTAVGSFVIGSADMSEADLEKLDGITNGTAAAAKAVVLDASKNIATLGTVGCGAITSTGASSLGSISSVGAVTSTAAITAGTSFIIGSADLNEADLEKLDGITNGAGAASKALVLDASRDINNINELSASTIFVETLNAITIDTVHRTDEYLEIKDKVILMASGAIGTEGNNAGIWFGGDAQNVAGKTPMGTITMSIPGTTVANWRMQLAFSGSTKAQWKGDGSYSGTLGLSGSDLWLANGNVHLSEAGDGDYAGNLNVASGKVYKVADTEVLSANGAAKVQAAVASDGLDHSSGLLSFKTLGAEQILSASMEWHGTGSSIYPTASIGAEPIAADSVMVYVNGLLQNKGSAIAGKAAAKDYHMPSGNSNQWIAFNFDIDSDDVVRFVYVRK